MTDEATHIATAAVMQYYYKDNACPAEHSRAETCICWHDEGKGPFPDLKNGDAIPMAYGSAIGLTWRTAPHPAPVEALDDPYAALSQHLHGDGDAPTKPMPNATILICRVKPHETPTCATPGCTNPPVIRLDDRRLCRDCYATHDFGEDE